MPVVCLLASCFAPMKAQGMAVTDSLWCQQSLPVCIVDDTHGLKLREVLIPTAVVGVSALYAVGGDWFSSQRECVQDALSGKGRNKVKIDDYLQYSQMVAVYGLNLAGVKGAHSFKDRTIILAMSWAVQAVLTNAMKYSFREKRPDSGARNSFPSGAHCHGIHGCRVPLSRVPRRVAMDRICRLCRGCMYRIFANI